MDPIIRVQTETGAIWDDPSEDLLYELLLDIERGDEQFFIIERLTDPSGQTFAQVIKDRRGWIVERREGGPAAHFSAQVTDLRVAHRVLLFWAYRPGAADAPSVSWDRLEL